jgi:hypothetical protein
MEDEEGKKRLAFDSQMTEGKLFPVRAFDKEQENC